MSTLDKQPEPKREITFDSSSLSASIEHIVDRLKELATIVHEDTIALAEMRAQMQILMKNFEELAVLVRNGSGSSLFSRITTLDNRVSELCKHVDNTATFDVRISVVEALIKELENKRKNMRYMIWGLITITLASLVPFIIQFFEDVARHIAQ